MATTGFSPRDFLKSRRPERFADSELSDVPVLDRSLLEYHLHTLTNRSQEKDFEHFARHLAQKEICPNLIPQTGPTGGGDSKVDSETFPVADDIALTWFMGIGRDAASERWAFAVSAKEDWRSKVRRISRRSRRPGGATRRRSSSRTNSCGTRCAPKSRTSSQRRYGLEVRILDRSWILDRVFTNRHEALAIEHLKLQTSIRTSFRKGPRDVEREQDLVEVEGRIELAAQKGRFGLSFVDDCLEAAELARDLERPRAEVDGRFDRAERVADKYGSTHQRFVCAYSRAWTAYWWHEDRPAVLRHYASAEGFAEGSRNAYELELLTNLWYILHSMVSRGETDSVDLERRTISLNAALGRLALERDRPSTSLQARSLGLMVRLVRSRAGDAESVFKELGLVIQESSGLVGFPLESLAETLTELGRFLGQHRGYEELFETILDVSSKRNQDVEAARLLLRRGAQRLDADEPTEAIRSLGRALVRLYKNESRHDLVRALSLCGVAYERLGLFWAARGALLNASSLAMDEFWKYEDVTVQQAACVRRLKWLELRLGRIPQLIAWHEIDHTVRSVLAERGYRSPHEDEEELNYDAILGILMLRTDLWQLGRLTRLPEVLDRMGLFNASTALRFALGDVTSVEADLKGSEIEADQLTDYFCSWRDQPAGESLPRVAKFYDTRTIRLDSRILGCRITVDASNDPSCITLAESILGILESLLATGVVDRIIALEPTLTMTIRAAEFTEKPFVYEVTEVAGRPAFELRCPAFDWAANPSDMRAVISDRLVDLTGSILSRVFLIDDFEQSLTKLFRDDRALERAVNFSVGFAAIGNILGTSPRTSLADWYDPAVHEHVLTRTEAWDGSCPPTTAGEGSGEGRDEKPAPRGVLETGRVSHSEIEAVSLIRTALWDRAKWAGTAFIGSEDDSMPPLLALIFGGAEAAGEIFRHLVSELGTRDEAEKLRLSIVRGVSRTKPLAYRIAVGSNPDLARSGPRQQLVVMGSRIHTMEPTSAENLDRFLRSYTRFGFYGLACCVFDSNPAEPMLVTKHVISKCELHVRQAWEVGPGDIDSPSIMDGDDPIIPPDRPDAPVLRLLEKQRLRAPGRPPDSGRR